MRPRSGSSSPAISRRGCWSSTAGWRSARNCRPRNSAGWCWSTRPSRSPASSTAWPTALSRRTTAGRAASMRCGIRSRTARGRGVPRPARPGRHPKDPRHPLRHPRALARAAARRLRHGVVNPPYTLADELKTVLPALHALLAEDPRAGMVDRMAGRRVSRHGCSAEVFEHLVRIERRILVGVAAAGVAAVLPSIGKVFSLIPSSACPVICRSSIVSLPLARRKLHGRRLEDRRARAWRLGEHFRNAACRCRGRSRRPRSR